MSQLDSINQLVLNADTRQKLLDQSLLSPLTIDNSFDVLAIPVMPKLPYPGRFTNIPAYLEYLGLQGWKAQKIFDSLKANIDSRNEYITEVMLFFEFEYLIQGQEGEENSWKNELKNNETLNSKDANGFMTELGFTPDFISDMYKLLQDTQQDPSYMTNLANEIGLESFNKLNILHFMNVVLVRRKINLKAFDKAMLSYLAN